MKIDVSKGRYWDEGITLVDGCTPCSPGCDHCWSAALAHRFYREGEPGYESGIFTDDEGCFNGNIMTHPKYLRRFNTRKPKVFAIWNDLFHEDVPWEFIFDVYNATEKSYTHDINHQFLILTKRPKRMLEFWHPARNTCPRPLDRVWHGLTVCNQQEADQKIPIFLQVPGKKFLSIEPILGEINITTYLNCFYGSPPIPPGIRLLGENEKNIYDGWLITAPRMIDAVILGGETGPGARPMNPDWVRSVRDQCAAAGVPFFFKQIGSKKKDYMADDVKQWGNLDKFYHACKDEKIDFQVNRMLDGVTHDDLPWVKDQYQ